VYGNICRTKDSGRQAYQTSVISRRSVGVARESWREGLWVILGVGSVAMLAGGRLLFCGRFESWTKKEWPLVSIYSVLESNT